MMLCSVLTVLYMQHDSNGVSLKAAWEEDWSVYSSVLSICIELCTKTLLVSGTPSSETCGASTANQHIHGFGGSREGNPEWYPAGFRFDPTLETQARQY